MSDREIIKVAVSTDAKRAIDQVAERYGMSQIELASRVYRWFADQEEVVQAAILDILPRSIAPQVAKMALEQLAAEAGEAPPRRRDSKK